jgi:hypothetical protein
MTDITVPLDDDAQTAMDAANNALLMQLIEYTPAELATWMAANATTFAQVQAVLCALVLAVQTDLT